MNFSIEEQVAQAVAELGKKRPFEGHGDAAGGNGYQSTKLARVDAAAPLPIGTQIAPIRRDSASGQQVQSSNTRRELQPAPFFYYKDFSRIQDPDPLTPLTAPGRVPNFPAKMQAILSRADLADIVAWMPHGRSWRILKPREFEIRVIPTYFEHSKFSSFIRQANGWGFRRITQGRDRNSYYHEKFLRGLPHLCKSMKRPGVAEKAAADPDHEPDFYKISEIYPVPEKAEDDSIMLQCTVQGGPKARMPIYSASMLTAPSGNYMGGEAKVVQTVSNSKNTLTPLDQSALSSFHQAVNASDNQIRLHQPQEEQQTKQDVSSQPVTTTVFLPQQNFESSPTSSTTLNVGTPTVAVRGADARMACLSAADQLAFALPPPGQNQSLQAQQAASQFAAGFAAATALSNNHMRNVLSQALSANFPFPQGQQQQVQQQHPQTQSQPSPAQVPSPVPQMQVQMPLAQPLMQMAIQPHPIAPQQLIQPAQSQEVNLSEYHHHH